MGFGEGRILSVTEPRKLTFLTRVQDGDLRALQPSNSSDALAILSNAFADAPMTQRVVGGSRGRRIRSLRLGIGAQLPAAMTRGTVLGVGSGAALAGVLVGARPYAHPFPPPALSRRLWVALAQGLGVAAQWAELFEALQARRPAEPHWYLALLGVAPAAQRRGLGGRLLRAWLAEVDAAGGAAWLETDEPRSLGLYRAAGFAVAGEMAFREVPIWLLSRAARRG
jgi:ribosomal protein S18 acetylase RimI-like enzyme